MDVDDRPPEGRRGADPGTKDELDRPDIVWLVERGCYSDQHIVGVFDSVAAAMAGLPGTFTLTIWTNYTNWPRRGPIRRSLDITNDLDWDDAVTISPLRRRRMHGRGDGARFTIKEQRLRQDGDWDYIELTAEEAAPLIRTCLNSSADL